MLLGLPPGLFLIKVPKSRMRRAQGSWVIDDHRHPVMGSHKLASKAAEAVAAARRQMYSLQRAVLRGLDRGRDEGVTATSWKELRCPIDQGMMGVLMSDTVSTLAKACMQWGYDGYCALCGHD